MKRSCLHKRDWRSPSFLARLEPRHVRWPLILALLLACGAHPFQAALGSAAPRRVDEPREVNLDTPRDWAVWLVGGLELRPSLGLARVVSDVEWEDGSSEKVASGMAGQLGWSITIGGPPRHTGFVIRPSAGFFSRSIAIADFRTDLPSPPGETAGRNIAAICSDPVTGETVDCAVPNEYQLTLRSLHGGARVGHQWVYEWGPFEFFAESSLAMNLIEWRFVRSLIGATTRSGTHWRLFGSFDARAAAGVHLVPARVALALRLDFSRYRSFEYPEPQEFRGALQYNEDKEVWEQPRVWVESARVFTTTMMGALIVVF